MRGRVLAGLVLAAATLPAAAQAQAYVRAGLGWDVPRAAGFDDVDCRRTAPPALFGCAAAVDGSPLGARGNFSSTPALEMAIGRRIHPDVRLELLGGWRPRVDFEGEANFLRTPGDQPVRAAGSSLSALAVAYYDFGHLGRARPFVGAGAGVARNALGSARYRFPGLGAGAQTTVPGGAHSTFAWMAAAGVAWRLSPRTTLDVAYRHTDLGRVRSREAEALVVRAGGTRTITVAGTEARLAADGFSLGLRWGF